jgi:hypothetical protein
MEDASMKKSIDISIAYCLMKKIFVMAVEFSLTPNL